MPISNQHDIWLAFTYIAHVNLKTVYVLQDLNLQSICSTYEKKKKDYQYQE